MSFPRQCSQVKTPYRSITTGQLEISRQMLPAGLTAALLTLVMLSGLTRTIPACGQTAKAVLLPLPQSAGAEPKETSSDVTEHAYYTVCMNLIQREWEANHSARVLELLEDTRHSRYRGFEWGYWNRLSHREVKRMQHPASAVAFSPDGSRIALGDGNGTVILCDAASGQELWTEAERPIEGRPGWITTLAFTPDGARLLSCDSESTTVVRDAKTGTAQRTLFGLYSGTRAAFLSDGKRMLINYRGSWGAIRDLSTGKDLLANPAKQYDQLYSVAASPNGKRFAHSSDDHKAHIWDAETGKELCATSAHTLAVDAMAFSPDSTKLVTGCRDGTAKVWDAETGRERLTLVGHQGEVWKACFSTDGRYIATGSNDGTARIWDATTGKELQIIRGHTDSVEALAFNPNSRQLLTGSRDGTARLWNLEADDGALPQQKPTPARPVPGNSEVRIVMSGRRAGLRVFSQDGKYVAVAWQNSADVWDIPLGKKLYRLEGKGEFHALAFSPDSALIATADDDRTARIWETATGKPLQTLKVRTGIVTALTFLSSSQWIATASADGTAKIWNSRIGQVRLTLKGHTAGVTSIRFFPVGNHLATESEDKTMRVWESATGRQIGLMPAGLSQWITLSEDGSRAVSFYPYSLRLWNLKTGQEIRTLPINSGFSRGIAFSPDARRVFIGASHRDSSATDYSDFRILDADSGRELLTLPNSPRRISEAHFSSDGKQILINYWDGYTSLLLAHL